MNSEKKKILLIRHGQSVFNEHYYETCLKLGVDPDKTNLVQFTFFPLRKDLLDAPLTNLGISQCVNARNEQKEKIQNVKLVLVTATTRALQTARHIFNTQDNHNKRLVVLPIFECTESVDDVFCNTIDNMEKFSEFDFSIVKKETDQFGWSWFARHYTNHHKRENLISHIDTQWKNFSYEKESVARGFAMVKFMEKFSPEIFENWKDFSTRVNNHEDSLIRFLLKKENAELKDNEIAFVGHNRLFKVMTAKSFDSESQPLEFWDSTNCEIKEHELELFDKL